MFNTRVTELFGIKYPIIQGALGGGLRHRLPGAHGVGRVGGGVMAAGFFDGDHRGKTLFLNADEHG